MVGPADQIQLNREKERMLQSSNTVPMEFDSRATMLWKRMRKNRLAVLGGALLIGFFLVAVGAPLIAPHDPLAQDLYNRLQGPSLGHPFGTDDFGRDILSRVIYGARISLRIGAPTFVYS